LGSIVSASKSYFSVSCAGCCNSRNNKW